MSKPTAASISATDQQKIARLERRLEREKAARKQAEALLEEKSQALSVANRELAAFAGALEERIIQRTAELTQERERAVSLSRQDLLTGLADRRYHATYLESAVAGALESGHRLAVYLLNVDHFRSINDTLGHAVGDAVLRAVASRLAACPGIDHAARLGGDEFALVATGISDVASAHDLALKMLDTLRQPIVADGRTLDITACIGYGILPDHATTPENLQRFADIALAHAKDHGRSQALGFNEKLRTEVEERRILGAELAQALSCGDILPWFQPIVDTVTGRVAGIEALARWRHPLRGMLSPSLFIPLAEEKNLMEPLFRAMLRRSCQLAAPLVLSGKLSYVSLNASPSQFRTSGLAATVQEVLAETGFPASALVIEITEELVMSNLRTAFRELSQLAKRGVRLALDDFGTGYSNIASLRKLPIDWLKLDRSLLTHVERQPVDQAIVRAVLQMAQGLGVEVIAEGIESKGQADWLSAAGCCRQQGYYYGKPQPFELLLPLFSRRNPV